MTILPGPLRTTDSCPASGCRLSLPLAVAATWFTYSSSSRAASIGPKCRGSHFSEIVRSWALVTTAKAARVPGRVGGTPVNPRNTVLPTTKPSASPRKLGDESPRRHPKITQHDGRKTNPTGKQLIQNPSRQSRRQTSQKICRQPAAADRFGLGVDRLAQGTANRRSGPTGGSKRQNS